MTPNRKQELRRLWFKVHKWLGLALAVPVILIFLSGSALVWKASIDDLLHPRRWVAAEAAQPATFYLAFVDRLIQPGERIASLTYPNAKGAVIVTAVSVGAGSRRLRDARYYLDPSDGRLLERSPTDAGPLQLLHRLHGSLLLPGIASRIVGLSAVALLLSAFSGLWLWWPSSGAVVRGMRWRRTQSINANLHHQAGYWVALPLIMLSLTGAWISFPRFFAAVSSDTAAVQRESILRSAVPLEATRMSVEQVLAAAGSPQARDLANISWPTTADPRWRVAAKDPVRPMTIAVVDDSGVAMALAPGPESKARLMRRLHDGTGMPFTWQLIIFVAGLLGSVLGLTGLIMWLSARARAIQMERRRRSHLAEVEA